MNSYHSPREQAETRDAIAPVSEDRAELPNLPSEKGRRGFLVRLRDAGERLTGGGIRALSKRLLLNVVRRLMAMVMRRPRLLALAHTFLKPFPRVTWRLNRLAEIADPFAGRVYLPSGRLSNYVDAITMTLPASARVIYLRLRAAASDTGSWNRL